MPAEMTEQVMVRLPPELYERLKQEADKEERSIAQTARLAIKQFLANR